MMEEGGGIVTFKDRNVAALAAGLPVSYFTEVRFSNGVHFQHRQNVTTLLKPC